MTVDCGKCKRPARVVEVNDHGTLFYGIDCPRCGLYVPHAVARARAECDPRPLP